MKQFGLSLSIILVMLGGIFGSSSTKLLTRTQMVAVLVDLELARAMVLHYKEDKSTTEALLEKNRLLIYELHGIDTDLFQNSYQYYLTKLEVLKEIYEEVIERLEELEAGYHAG